MKSLGESDPSFVCGGEQQLPEDDAQRLAADDARRDREMPRPRGLREWWAALAPAVSCDCGDTRHPRLMDVRTLGHHGCVADSLRSQPRRVRAARRASLPVVRTRRPRSGRHHPASASDVRRALTAFGEQSYYGLDTIELVPAPSEPNRLPLGQFVAPGRILLFDQTRSPWRLGFGLDARDQDRFIEAGAEVEAEGVITWPRDTLKRFMLGYVLTHELGHHILQHERRLRNERAARTRDHEARAEAIAANLRTLLT